MGNTGCGLSGLGRQTVVQSGGSNRKGHNPGTSNNHQSCIHRSDFGHFLELKETKVYTVCMYKYMSVYVYMYIDKERERTAVGQERTFEEHHS